MWDLIVSVPDHCLSFYFSRYRAKSLDHEIYVTDLHYECEGMTFIHQTVFKI